MIQVTVKPLQSINEVSRTLTPANQMFEVKWRETKVGVKPLQSVNERSGVLDSVLCWGSGKVGWGRFSWKRRKKTRLGQIHRSNLHPSTPKVSEGSEASSFDPECPTYGIRHSPLENDERHATIPVYNLFPAFRIPLWHFIDADAPSAYAARPGSQIGGNGGLLGEEAQACTGWTGQQKQQANAKHKNRHNDKINWPVGRSRLMAEELFLNLPSCLIS